MGFWAAYAGVHGLPRAIYLDRFSTYKMNASVATTNHDLKTQLQRAMDTLGVQLIFALSPQAKGRAATAADEARGRDRGRRRPRADLHRPLGLRDQKLLPETRCRVERRQAMGDFTVSFQAAWHQLLPTPGLAIRPKDEVVSRDPRRTPRPGGCSGRGSRGRRRAPTPPSGACREATFPTSGIAGAKK